MTSYEDVLYEKSGQEAERIGLAGYIGLAEYIGLETKRHVTLGATEDSREAFIAFAEKRRPHFQER